MARTPVYFIPHGGPTFMYENHPGGDKGAFDYLRHLGRDLIQKHKENPDSVKGVIVMSAHWESANQQDENPKGTGNNEFPKVNGKGIPVGIVTDKNDNYPNLEYDFFNFPAHMYEEKFWAKGNHASAEKIAKLIDNTPGYYAQLRSDKKWDHGVWVASRVMFEEAGEEKGALKFPIINISEPAGDDVDHLSPRQLSERFYNLGKALAPLRDEGYWIIGSGMSVHNLRERRKFADGGEPEYSQPFEDAVKDVVENVTSVPVSDEQNLENLSELWKNPHRPAAHPTAEHLFPFYFSAGAADGDKGVQEYTKISGSTAWGLFKWGGSTGDY
ncbi:Extradiol ring-cleavage dioxygenase, class III enzyme, subunit B [Yarrowia lipolytica]|jgi:4,5-DOPA dioxygenase extradiol|uniref:YALI0E04488p n=2 Tax=Yarrowia lipolytica TaxID=4952 RepID=Q6C719_YARLI|nr:YALI0E04488p [Yarrowia lipolytica CLIB122]AOW04946.1 hypothetical protein YALI1_E05416g [Yarrowia lipolytica]KAB8286229.1 Extradiol ring-cleavage dioxygenase, class III enzyme, subunit B [Yarrowia lipolytica]KAE8171553.1 Extradiol ring-cleavage dioxygenase, class III enzyme, subunit B [Yarrowia lipolytica]KAJ8056522.1 Extradiol ring-cleavage dioxygenase, class III enzyme, subunit B [Yarrowia lipolytica]QNP98786.1 Hypothetical protein YALI2_E00102g [Yarrowia lipolytica]|eukprot:XP_503543.1 YALI0E04488p [Yarrowia lipolytica CLIB122]